jgi:hypothetical protein
MAPHLVGYNLVGILIMQALVNAQANRKHKNIIDSTFVLVFMGTPHSGPTNDLMTAVGNDSLFSNILKENWRY